jgi:predicted transcriptional regulator of viral defense system
VGTQPSVDKAVRAFRRAGGILRTREALRHGIHRRTLYAMRDSGHLEELARGVFLLRGHPFSEKVDAVVVAARQPKAIVCLASALLWHDITTQLPHELHIALPRGVKNPRVSHPPLRVYWLSEPAYSAGIERHLVHGIPVRVYSVAKTVADCFKFRNKVGMDVALEALKDAWRERRATVDELTRYAKIDRVDKVIRPYLESVV